MNCLFDCVFEIEIEFFEVLKLKFEEIFECFEGDREFFFFFYEIEKRKFKGIRV